MCVFFIKDVYVSTNVCVYESFGRIHKKCMFIVVTCETRDKSEVRWEGLHHPSELLENCSLFF